MGVASTHATVTSLVGFQDFYIQSTPPVLAFGLQSLHGKAKQEGSVQNYSPLVGAGTEFLRKYLQH